MFVNFAWAESTQHIRGMSYSSDSSSQLTMIQVPASALEFKATWNEIASPDLDCDYVWLVPVPALKPRGYQISSHNRKTSKRGRWLTCAHHVARWSQGRNTASPNFSFGNLCPFRIDFGEFHRCSHLIFIWVGIADRANIQSFSCCISGCSSNFS